MGRLQPLAADPDLAEAGGWSRALTGALLAGCVVVPCVFVTSVDAVFVVPKLAALWALLALGFAVAAGGMAYAGTLARPGRRRSAVDVAVAAFVVLNVAAWSRSPDRRQSLYGERLQYQGFLTLLLYVAFFYLARLSFTGLRRTRLLCLAVTLGMALVAAYAIVQKTGLDPIWHGYVPSGRVFSSIGQANALAAYLVLAIPLASSLLAAETMLRAAVLVAVAVALLALLFTLSRAGYLALLVTLAVLAAGGDLRRTARRVSAAFAVAVVAATILALLVPPVRATVAESWRRVTSSAGSTDEQSFRFHLDAWKVAAHVAVDHPVLGAGQEMFPELFPRYSHSLLPPERAASLDAFRVESPHNVYLAIAAGAGFPALVAYAVVVAGVARALWRAARAAGSRQLRLVLVAALAALAAHLVTDAFMTADVTGTWLFWLVMGAGLALASRSPGRPADAVS